MSYCEYNSIDFSKIQYKMESFQVKQMHLKSSSATDIFFQKVYATTISIFCGFNSYEVPWKQMPPTSTVYICIASKAP